MTRYILIDNHSGYIWGDSADIGGRPVEGAPVKVARALDKSVGEHSRGYEEVSRYALTSDDTGYHVYSVEPDFPEVPDGQDQAMIHAAEHDGKYVTTIRCLDDEAA